MGTRIHKMMGYGLTDLVEGDPRLNWDSPLFRYDLDGREHVERYLDWAAERGEFDVARSLLKDKDARQAREFDVQRCFAWGTKDYGLGNVFCARPLAWTDWYRSDDAIDWQEQTMSPGGQRDDVKVSRHGIYPHISYMDLRDGERIKNSDVHAWHRSRYRLEEEGEGPAGYLRAALEELARMAGFDGHDDALRHCVPHVPDEVRRLAEFAEAFTDPSVALQLRPMVYTWWG